LAQNGIFWPLAGAEIESESACAAEAARASGEGAIRTLIEISAAPRGPRAPFRRLQLTPW
jgi:hypothetical protein